MKTKKRLLGILLSLVMMLGLLPGMGMTAYAVGTVTEVSTADAFKTAVGSGGKVKLTDSFELPLDNALYFEKEMTIDLNGHTINVQKEDRYCHWGIYAPVTIKDSASGGAIINPSTQNAFLVGGGSLTLEGGTLEFTGNGNGIDAYMAPFTMTGGTIKSNRYSIWREGAEVSVSISGGTINGDFRDTKGEIDITGGSFSFDPSALLKEGYSASKVGDYWVVNAAVYYNVTLSGGANATVSGGEVKQTGITGEMKTVTYTAKSGYKFPESSDYFKTTNGITVARTSDTVVTVSGTPEADTEITVPGAEEVPVHRHDIQLVKEKEPTCTEDGYEEHYECTECGKWFADKNGNYEYSDSEIAELKKKATGHKWDNGVVTVEPTYDETGIKTYTCSVCGEIKEETIPKKTRSYSNDSDNDSSDSGSSGGGSSGKSGSFSTQSLDVNGNAFGGPSAGHQPDSGMPLSDRGGNWGSMANNWSYTKSDGTLARNEWLNLEYNGHTYWYFFDGNSTMQTDWFNYNGATYYFVPDMDGWRGRMATGWHQIGEKWYYFEPTAGAYQGVMYRGAVTPDGHIVGADGAWNGVGTTPESSAQTGTTASGN